MPYSQEDKALIKNLYLLKGYGSRRLLTEFPEKNWTKPGINSLLKKLRKTGSKDRRPGSGRLKSARIEENVTAVGELCLRLIGRHARYRERQA